jgi:branched-chain amino acid transport system permease protein
MTQALDVFIIPGLTFGCIYAIVASGMVLTYTTSGVINLGYGAVAYTMAYFFWELNSKHGMSTWPALLLCVLVIGPLLGIVLWQALFRWLVGLGILAPLIGSIGLAVALPPILEVVFHPGTIQFAPALSKTGFSIHKWWVIVISGDQIDSVLAALATAAFLIVVLRYTLLGLKMRAVFDSRTVAAIVGANTNFVSNLSWALSGSMAAIGGIFLAPILGLDQTAYLILTVASLAAALIGGLRSIPITFVAALLLGVAGSSIEGISQTSQFLQLGVQPSLPFIFMAATVLMRRNAISIASLPRRTFEVAERFDSGRALALMVAIPGAIAVLLPVILNAYWTGVVALGFVYAVIFLSFTYAFGLGGMLPLGQTAFVGIGGLIAGGMVDSVKISIIPAILIGAAAAALIGAVLALAGAGLGVLEFGFLTLAFGLFADYMLYNWGVLVPQVAQGRSFGIPSLFGWHIASENDLYYFFVAVLGVSLLGFGLFRRQLASFYVNGVRMNPGLAVASAVSTRLARVTAFALASFMAGLGGGLLGIYQRHIGPADVTTYVGLVWFAVVVLMGIRSPVGAIAAGLSFAVFPALLAHWLPIRWGPVATIGFGLGALSLASDPRGAVSVWTKQGKAIASFVRRRPTPQARGEVA